MLAYSAHLNICRAEELIIYKDFKERNLKCSSKIVQNRSLKFPLDFEPQPSHLPLHKLSIPTHSMCDTGNNLNSNSCRRKHVKRKIVLKKNKKKKIKNWKIRKRRISQSRLPNTRSSSPKCFMYNFQPINYHRFPPLGLQNGYPIRQFDKFFELVPEPKARHKVFVKNDNQYLVCVHPPLFHETSFKTKRNCSKVIRSRDKFKHLTSQRQCSNNCKHLVSKMKRSPVVSNSTRGVDTHKNFFKKVNSNRINKKSKSSNETVARLKSPKRKKRPSSLKKSLSSRISEKSSPELSMDVSRPSADDPDDSDSDSDSSESSREKDDDEPTDDKKKSEEKEEKESTSSDVVTRDLTKVNEILSEVKSMLEKYSDETDASHHPVPDDYKDLHNLAKHDKKMKKKIDKAIPILIQISQELKDFSAHPERSKLTRKQKKKIKRKKKAKEKKELEKFRKETKVKYKKSKLVGKYGKISSRDAEAEGEPGMAGCKADGTWWSRKTGVEITMNTKSNKMLKVNVNPTKYSRIIDSHWLMQGLTLSDHGGPFILAAIFPKKKKIASFVGQCKTCQGEDIIFGSWTISSCCHQCNEFGISIETVLDVFKRRVK